MKANIVNAIVKGLPKQETLNRLALILSLMDDDSRQEEIIAELVDGVPTPATFIPTESENESILEEMRRRFSYREIIDITEVNIMPLRSKITTVVRLKRWFKTKEDADSYIANKGERFGISSNYVQTEQYPVCAEFDDTEVFYINSSELEDFGLSVNKI